MAFLECHFLIYSLLSFEKKMVMHVIFVFDIVYKIITWIQVSNVFRMYSTPFYPLLFLLVKEVEFHS